MASENQILKPLVDACEGIVPATLWQQHRSVVAVSGGADSVALFRALVHITRRNPEFEPSRLIVGHVDHGVRGEDSAADKDFVQSIANEFNVGFVSAKLDLAKLLDGRENASEDLLRDARYGCLRKIAQDHDARYLFTGHHLNDQAETILFRIFRGTGLTGLKGIPPIRRDGQLTIVRPLLKVSKEKILEAVTALDQPFCTDSTNASSEYGRNFIRNEILKSAQDYFGLPVAESVARLADHAIDAQQMQGERVDDFFAASPPVTCANAVEVKTSTLMRLSNGLIRAILIRIWQQQHWPVSQMTFERWQALAERIRSASAAEHYIENLPGDLRFELNEKQLKISNHTGQ